jgi:hypothetical protein
VTTKSGGKTNNREAEGIKKKRKSDTVRGRGRNKERWRKKKITENIKEGGKKVSRNKRK